jgi:hypothetical protein
MIAPSSHVRHTCTYNAPRRYFADDYERRLATALAADDPSRAKGRSMLAGLVRDLTQSAYSLRTLCNIKPVDTCERFEHLLYHYVVWS